MKHMACSIVYSYILLSLSFGAFASGNQTIQNFNLAKKMVVKIHQENPHTIYCDCTYIGKKIDLNSCSYKVHKDTKRAARLEWEHVVPAENFGRSFSEWRSGSHKCGKKKGRKCAETNPEFSRIEADLYNLWPIVGEVNGLRSNFNPAELQSGISFGGCKAMVNPQERKFMPENRYKGIVARTYMYMDQSYPEREIISDKNRKLFEAWDKQYPVTEWECKRAKKIEKIQGNVNGILQQRCNK